MSPTAIQWNPHQLSHPHFDLARGEMRHFAGRTSSSFRVEDAEEGRTRMSAGRLNLSRVKYHIGVPLSSGRSSIPSLGVDEALVLHPRLEGQVLDSKRLLPNLL